ncbi:uncharacterized protein LOC132311233 [Cornus florida]|uniref:uncharacterized protein LOC132311233 n=1 Tax=Cornus florida TaxID=4283 RepID=UPI00289A9983|nr:uncharacterized protein LOC132311233 [Cornus florida]
MGSLVGHVAPGFGFFAIGLWHLLNHIKLHALHPNSYTSLPWFPTSKLRYLELFLIMGGSFMSIAMELFIGPSKHQPLDSDGTIPSYHLRNFEHSSISMSLFVYAAFAILLDRIGPKAQYGLTLFLGAIAFGQQLLVFHFHSTDHMGVEGQYHLLLQIVISVSLTTTLMGIGYPKSFTVNFLRSLSILFQGVWFMVMGFMLWTPELVPKGCFLNLEDGHIVVRCHDEEALERAKSLVNLQFSWYLIVVTIFAISIYLALMKTFGKAVDYQSLTMYEEDEEQEDNEDVEAQKKSKLGELKSSIYMGKGLTSIAKVS